MIQISISNMHCQGCAKGVRSTLQQVAPGVTPSFDLERRQLGLDVATPKPVLEALIADGWDARLVMP